MCGITGALAFKDSGFRVTTALVDRMRDTMAHRGPNGGGTWVAGDGGIGLGHRRLSIIDLSSAADQPMSNEDGSLRVVFNGEIYNHAEIRRELEQSGRHRWKTDHSDTEVILHAFEEWGIACLERFRGMFAIALWEAKARRLWLVRDRIGIKPLYYSMHHGRITFASEIKALLKDSEQRREVDEEAFFHFLSFITTPGPQTLFAGIKKLGPATWLCVNEDGSMREERYWDVWDHARPLKGASEAELAERVLAELRVAVRLRKVSDVPVGVFLSGGIDSSTNAALFSEDEASAVKTFTVGYRGEYQSYRNELSFARLMADRIGAEHHEVLLGEQDLLDFLPEMIRLQDEPIADPVCVPLYYVSKLARQHGAIVCQVGEGSDELFWGYYRWKLMLRLQQLNRLPVPAALKRMGMLALGAAGKQDGYPYELLRRGAEGLPIFWGGVDYFSPSEKLSLLSPRLGKRFSGFSSWEAVRPVRRRFEEKAWEPSDLHWMSYADLSLRLPELLLMRVDKMSMGVSLEARVPFLDHEFVTLAMSIPSAVKTRNGILKYILKKAVRGVIPDELIDRPKQGFGVPIDEWLFAKLGDFARRELHELCRTTDFLEPSAVRRLFQINDTKKLWVLLNFALWHKHFIADCGC